MPDTKPSPSTISISWGSLPVKSTVSLSCASDRSCALTLMEATPDGVKPDWAAPIPTVLTFDVPKAGNYVIGAFVDFIEPAPAITTVTLTVSAKDSKGAVIKEPQTRQLSGKRGDLTDSFFLLFKC